MMAYNLLQSMTLLGDAADSFTERMLMGTRPTRSGSTS
jgi:fumarate hydratase class II